MHKPESKARWILFGALVLATGLLPVGAESAGQAESWRSSVYPEDWTPGFADGEGRFLHDLSYAGYHAGEQVIPLEPPGVRLNVTQPPYQADATGERDATAAIQRAIDDAGAAGGGVVYLSEGTYRIVITDVEQQGLRMNRSGVVLRGAGPEVTRVFLDTS